MKLIRLLIVLIVFLSCSDSQNRILPEERTIIESVYSSVLVQPDSLYQAYAIVSGILDKNLIEEGDLVYPDQPIIQIINNTPKLNAQNAKFALDLAQENYSGSADILGSIEDEIKAAKLKCKNDSINYFRQKNLWEQDIGTKVDYDVKKLNYELSTNNLQLLQSRYYRTKNELITAVRQAQNNYQTALLASEDFTVNSRINGMVYALYKEPGEIVNTNEPIAAIGSASQFVIEMLVDEVDIVKVVLDQDILITLDAYPNEVFKGKVSKIYPKKDERNQTFKVEAVFDIGPDVLYPGLSGEANIIISKKEKALTIPKSYLINSNKVQTDKGLVIITTGLKNMDYVEVLEGITKDTYITKLE